MKTLNEILIERRKYLDFSLRDAAKAIGMSHSYLSNLEKGLDPRTGAPIKPTPETLELISKAYGLDYNDLMIAAGYLSEDENGEVLNKEKFADRLIKKLDYNGFIDDDMSIEEINELVNKVIKIIDISKSN